MLVTAILLLLTLVPDPSLHLVGSSPPADLGVRSSLPVGQGAAAGVGGPRELPGSPSTARCSLAGNRCADAAGGAASAGWAPRDPQAASNWPAVEIVFLVETTPYDGAFDPTAAADAGYDPCLANASSHPCEESNGVPFFVQNAGTIAEGIASAHPGVNVTFAMVDYAATCDAFDDCDSLIAHTDVANFTDPSGFGSAVNATFGTDVLVNGSVPDDDMNDSLLHSSSITALYGVLAGGLVHWSSAAHHVLVLVGSTAPRDPHYPEDYAVSASFNATSSAGPLAPTCEPSYVFANGTSPACEGWVTDQDGNTSHSIAALALNGSACAASLGANCTIDSIDLWTTSTDPASPGWPSRFASIGGGPDGAAVVTDTANVVASGCAIARATGGSWDGPSFDSCGGQPGTLTLTGWNATFAGSENLYLAYLRLGLGEPPFYPVWFNETGLPAGTNWSVTFYGLTAQTLTSGSSSITFMEPNGTEYAFVVGSVAGYVALPTSGSVNVTGAGVANAVAFTPAPPPNFPLWFNETGLAPGLNWSVQILGTGSYAGSATNSSTGTSVGFAVPAGFTGQYTTNTTAAYAAFPATGPVDTPSAGGSTTVFVAFSTAPLVTSFRASPPELTVGDAVTFSASASGGFSPLTYAYLHLPAGCASQNLSTFTCIPNATGNSTVTVQVTDLIGRSSEAYATVTVDPVSGPGGGNGTGGSGGPFLGLSPIALAALAIGAVAVVVALVVAVRWRRDRARPPPTEPPADDTYPHRPRGP